MRSIFSCCLLIWANLLIVGAPTPARADTEADRAAITGRLQRWAAAFNARDAAGACDLFARNLISTVPGALDGGRDAVCGRLAILVAKPDVQLHYSPDIQEIIVSGDIAVVRLFWTLTIQQGTQQHSSKEAGMDIFQRQPDGIWSIIRFLAFSTEPDPNDDLSTSAPKPSSSP
jgi:uncharacterized protein (TIGR02246 family)